MDTYRWYLSKYSTLLWDLEQIISDTDWRDYLSEIAEDIFLAYLCRKELEKSPYRDSEEIKTLDEELIKIAERLKNLHPPAYRYFLKHFQWLIKKIVFLKR